MGAILEDLLTRTARLSEEVAQPLSGSRKIYVSGHRADLRVAMREVRQTPTPANSGP